MHKGSKSLFEFYVAKALANHSNGSPSREKSYRLVKKDLEAFFQQACSYADLNHPRQWARFARHLAHGRAASTHRVRLQDTNNILKEMWLDGKVRHIKLKIPPRKKLSSEGFGVNGHVGITQEDLRKLGLQARRSGNKIMALVFALVLCSLTRVRYLKSLTVAGIGGKNIIINCADGGLIVSVLLEPARSQLIEYALSEGLTGEDVILPAVTEPSFSRWLKAQCKAAGVPKLTSKSLCDIARYEACAAGVLGWVVDCLGKKNAFSPFTEKSLRRCNPNGDSDD